MALWYHSGNGWTKSTLAYRDHNCAAFLCCGGPSLKKIDPSLLKGPNRIVFGLNNVYPYVMPDWWIGMDDPKCYHRDIFHQPFPKIMRGGYQNRVTEKGLIHNKFFNLYYADTKKTDNFDDTFILRSHDVNFVWHWSTIATALHIIVWMGCKDIYLFGNDLNNKKVDYFDNVKLNKKNKDSNEKFYNKVYEYLRLFKENGKKYGINLYSCSENSRAHDYLEYFNYKDVISNLEGNLYKGPLLHASDAEDIWKEAESKANNTQLGAGPQI
tara:strand:- start:4558 stop:5364 length:807 start_codon:yes stop_codon:yes gene_type:complete